MKIRKSYLLILGVLFSCASNHKQQPEASLPNIVYILADDLGYGDVSVLNPESKIKTPNIDALAANGMIFTDAHSSSAVCTPSRYSILTGRYAWKTRLKKGVLTGFSQPLIEENRETVASVLKKKGYETACIGKWHLGMNWQTTDGKVAERKGGNVDFSKEIQNTPTSNGFDYYYGIPASLDMSPFVFIENNKVVETPNHKFKGRSAFGRPGYSVKGLEPEDFLPALTEKTVKQIKKYGADGKKPFFIYMPLPAPHTPVAPNKEFIGKSDAGKYGDFVVEVDHTVGRIMSALKEAGIEKNTLVIVTSDNGPEVHAYARIEEYKHESMGKLRGAKRDSWEGGHRVPFFAHWPANIKKGSKYEKTICLSDLLATVADITKQKVSKETGEDSYSILSAFKGKNKEIRPFTIHHSAHGNFSIRKGDWVLIDHNSGNDNKSKAAEDLKRGYKKDDLFEGQLFNLKKDIREFKNLYNVHSEKVKELKTLLEENKE